MEIYEDKLGQSGDRILSSHITIYNITRCYGKHVAVFAVAVAAGDIIKYQSFVYGSFVWGIHVRYNKPNYYFSTLKIHMSADLKKGSFGHFSSFCVIKNSKMSNFSRFCMFLQ